MKSGRKVLADLEFSLSLLHSAAPGGVIVAIDVTHPCPLLPPT
jgi:hypothetical protein